MTGNLPLRYSMLIRWSDEDAAFLVTLPEWERHVNNPVTHGATYEEAVTNGWLVLQDLMIVSEERGQSLPEPRVGGVA
jgi:antitoxin HicB